MFSMYSYLIVNLVFSRLGIWNLNFFLIAPFPDHCLLVPTFLLEGELMTPTMGCVLMDPRSTTGDKINKEDNLRLLHTT